MYYCVKNWLDRIKVLDAYDSERKFLQIFKKSNKKSIQNKKFLFFYRNLAYFWIGLLRFGKSLNVIKYLKKFLFKLATLFEKWNVLQPQFFQDLFEDMPNPLDHAKN